MWSSARHIPPRVTISSQIDTYGCYPGHETSFGGRHFSRLKSACSLLRILDSLVPAYQGVKSGLAPHVWSAVSEHSVFNVFFIPFTNQPSMIVWCCDMLFILRLMVVPPSGHLRVIKYSTGHIGTVVRNHLRGTFRRLINEHTLQLECCHTLTKNLDEK